VGIVTCLAAGAIGGGTMGYARHRLNGMRGSAFGSVAIGAFEGAGTAGFGVARGFEPSQV
jgi:hypothetical protein